MDIQTIQIMLVKIAVFAPITTAIVQAVKMSELVPLRFLPLVAIALGAVFGFFFVSAGALGILAGIALGLASVGLFELGRTTVAGK